MFLTAEQLQELTGRVRRGAQVQRLRFMGIEHRVRADGVPMVLRAHIDKIFDGVIETAKTEQRVEPNWDAIA